MFKMAACIVVIAMYVLSLSRQVALERSPYYNTHMPRVLRSRPDDAESPIREMIRRLGLQSAEDTLLRRLERFRSAEASRPGDTEAVFGSGPPEDGSGAQNMPEYTESLPGSWERESRELGIQKHYPICHLERKIVNLNTMDYEYRPAHYEEVKCTQKEHDYSVNEICSSLGFSCFQWNKTIHLTRRRYSSECWETKTLIIPAGCECMWPTHKLGDIKLHL